MNERLIGFTPLLGGFTSKPLDVHEHIAGVDNENGLILVSTTRRTLVFGSRLSGWEEFDRLISYSHALSAEFTQS